MGRATWVVGSVILALWGGTVGYAQPANSDHSKCPDLLLNGSFETGTDPGSYKPLNPGAPDIRGWTVTRGQIDYVTSQSGHGSSASAGNRYVDLDGTPGNGGVMQRVATTPGHQYELSFDLGGDRNGAPTIKVMGLSINGKTQTFRFDSSKPGVERHKVTFTADHPQTAIEFFSMHNNNGLYGPVLDNVRLTDPTGCHARIKAAYRIGQLFIDDRAMIGRRKHELETELNRLQQAHAASKSQEETLIRQHEMTQSMLDDVAAQLAKAERRYEALTPDLRSPDELKRQLQHDIEYLATMQDSMEIFEQEVSAAARQMKQAELALQNAQRYHRQITRTRLTPAQRHAEGQRLIQAQEEFRSKTAHYQQLRDHLAQLSRDIRAQEAKVREGARMRPNADQRLKGELQVEIESLRNSQRRGRVELDSLDRQFNETRLRSDQLQKDLLETLEEYRMPVPAFVQRVEGKVDGKVVYLAEFDTAPEVFADIDARIREMEEYNQKLTQARKEALAQYVEAEQQAIDSGYKLATVQHSAAWGRMLVELGGDTYDILKRTSQAGIAGAGIELVRKLSERVVFNSAEQGTLTALPKDSALSLSSDIEQAVEAEIRHAFEATRSGDEEGLSASEEASLDKLEADAAKTGLKRVAKDSVSRMSRDWVTRKFFNTRLGEEVFDAVNGQLTNFRNPKQLGAQLEKLRNPGKYFEKGTTSLRQSLIKDGLILVGKGIINDYEMSVFRDYTLNNYIARQYYAAYAVLNKHSYEAEEELRGLLEDKQEYLARNVDVSSGFRQTSDPFDEDKVLEITVTLRDPAGQPERLVLLNQATAGGQNHQYFVRVNRAVAGANPENMRLLIAR